MRLLQVLAPLGAIVIGCGDPEPSPQADTDTDATSTGMSTTDPGCMSDDDCPEGERCEQATGLCVPPLPTPDATRDPAPPDFTDEVIPFFRGQVCMVHEVQSGAEFSVYVNPCLHPCIGASEVEYRHAVECAADGCDAYIVMWVTGSSLDACPENAFGRFAAADCSYMTPVEVMVDASLDGAPFIGGLRLELPYVSNEDAAMIAADPEDAILRQQIIGKHVRDDNRVPDMRDVDLQPGHPAPPPTCSLPDACPCYEVGF